MALRLCICLLVAVLPLTSQAPTDWAPALRGAIARLDASTPGNLGVFVRRLSDGSQLDYQATRKWYLASTVKVPVAIALLQQVEAGRLSLDDELTLRRSDYVDGSGQVLWREPGTRLQLGYLLAQMLAESDSTAADMIIRRIGEKQLNEQIRERVAPDFGLITTLLQVRYDAYHELHPGASRLTNMDFIEFKKHKLLDDRLRAFLTRLGLRKQQLKARSIEEAFERYYEKGLNSAPLVAYARMLEKLVKGELLSAENTKLVLRLMEEMVTGEKRIKAGLMKSAKFAQKTGTQIGRVCNMGVLNPQAGSLGAVVVAACVEKFKDQEQAEAVLEGLGQAISQLTVFP